jgi:RNA polymerase sigma factor (sigma-70 family)
MLVLDDIDSITEVTEINPEDHLGLVCMIVSKYVPRGVKTEDTEEYSEGVLALINACRKYKPEMGPFSTYAGASIKKSLIQRWRRSKRQKRQGNIVSIDESKMCEARIDKIDTSDVIAEMFGDHVDDTDADKRNKRILFDHYINDMTLKEIGNQMGTSRAYAHQCENKALELIRKRFAIDDFSKLEEILALT